MSGAALQSQPDCDVDSNATSDRTSLAVRHATASVQFEQNIVFKVGSQAMVNAVLSEITPTLRLLYIRLLRTRQQILYIQHKCKKKKDII